MVKSNTDGAARPSKTFVAKKRTNTQAVAPLKPQRHYPIQNQMFRGYFSVSCEGNGLRRTSHLAGDEQTRWHWSYYQSSACAQTVDVKYVMGGSEKNVQLKYISQKDKIVDKKESR